MIFKRFIHIPILITKNHRPRRHSLTLTQLVALARYTRELLPQPLWSCMKIFQTLTNCPKIKFSDHKAAAGAVRRRRKRLVAAGCKPASAWSAVFTKGVQSQSKLSSFTHRITIPTTPLTQQKTYIPTV